MKTVLAALDETAAARPVMETALGVGLLLDAAVEALHVGDRAPETLPELAAGNATPLRVLPGPDVRRTLLEATAAPHIAAVVVGARATPGGRRPVGGTALAVAEGASKPVVVVPPEAVGVTPRPFRRLLVPLEGDEASSQPVVEQLWPLLSDDVDLVVLHVFTADTVPPVLDHPDRDMDLLADEFLARHCPCASRVVWRTGPVGEQVTATCAEESCDLIVLSWSQDSSDGHAAVVQSVLSTSTVPVLLLPAG